MIARRAWPLAIGMAFAMAALAAARPAPGRYPLACTYVARGGALAAQGPCARMERETPRIDPRHLARMAFDKGLAEVRIASAGIAYVRRDGHAALVFIFDNGADYFEEGLARGLRHGKLVYYDRRLRPVIVTGYDWGEPFAHGRARVCIGCKLHKLGDEHSFMDGGRWGVIDRRGKLVVPLAPQPARQSLSVIPGLSRDPASSLLLAARAA